MLLCFAAGELSPSILRGKPFLFHQALPPLGRIIGMMKRMFDEEPPGIQYPNPTAQAACCAPVEILDLA